jgi:catalase-peroxidase
MQSPFAPGRTDTTQELTHVVSFAVLEPKADGFRNYLQGRAEAVAAGPAGGPGRHADATVPEITVLIGGMRTLNANYGQSPHGVLTRGPASSATTSS